MSPAATAIDALAVARLTRLVTTDTITAPLRERVFARYPPSSSRLGYVLTCDYCASIYAAAAIAATHTRALRPFRPLVYILAIAAPTAILADRQQTQTATNWS